MCVCVCNPVCSMTRRALVSSAPSGSGTCWRPTAQSWTPTNWRSCWRWLITTQTERSATRTLSTWWESVSARTHAHTHKHTHARTHKDTQTHRHTHTHTQRHTDTHTKTHRQTVMLWILLRYQMWSMLMCHNCPPLVSRVTYVSSKWGAGGGTGEGTGGGWVVN